MCFAAQKFPWLSPRVVDPTIGGSGLLVRGGRLLTRSEF